MPDTNSCSQSQAGGAQYYHANGGKYRVHVGPRGGKFINVKGQKRYI